MEGRSRDHGEKQRFQRRIIACLVVADILLAFLVSARFFFRIDMSRNAIYTLSAASKGVVAGLPEQLSITYFVSDALRSRYPFPSQIEDLLDEYATWSRGRISVTSIDPSRGRPSVSPESAGVMPRQMQVVDRDQVNLATVYSGIVMQYLDRTAALPFVSDLTTLEYDITSQMRALVQNRPRTIGILLGDSRRSLAQNFRYLRQELSFQFQVREVERGAEVPADVPVLFVIGNRDIDDNAMLRIDQFIMRGGKALFAVDSVDVDLAAGLAATVEKNHVVEDALAQYGVRVDDALVLDVLNQKISYSVRQGQYMVSPYPFWVALSGRDVSATHPITARFAGLDLYWPCPIGIIERQGVSAQVLARTSPNAWLMKDNFSTNPALGPMLEQSATGRAQYDLAVALSGTFRSAYAGRSIVSPQGESGPKRTLLESSAATRIIVVGDANFASDMIQYTQAQYNMGFLSNCAVWLAQDDDLLTIKTRAQVDTRLDAITDPAGKAAAMRSAMIINVALVPLLVVAFGVARLLIRRRRKGQAAREDT